MAAEAVESAGSSSLSAAEAVESAESSSLSAAVGTEAAEGAEAAAALPCRTTRFGRVDLTLDVRISPPIRHAATFLGCSHCI